MNEQIAKNLQKLYRKSKIFKINKSIVATMKKKKLNEWEPFNNLDITFMSYINFA